MLEGDAAVERMVADAREGCGLDRSAEQRQPRPDDHRVHLEHQLVDLLDELRREHAAAAQPDAPAVLLLQGSHVTHGVRVDDRDRSIAALAQSAGHHELIEVRVGTRESRVEPTW